MTRFLVYAYFRFGTGQPFIASAEYIEERLGFTPTHDGTFHLPTRTYRTWAR